MVCKSELEANYESSMPDNPVMGGTYPSYVSHFYCPKCGLMYQKEVVDKEK